MNLLARQHAFRAAITVADDDDGTPFPGSPGMAIYRNAYRGRLLSALEVSFARTRQWVGEDAFTAAACHHVLTIPPTGWTLDAYGAQFPALLDALFAQDPEVAELAWLEWHLQQAFAAPDAATLDLAALSAHDADDWERLCFDMAPGFAMRAVATNCTALWTALLSDDAAGFAVQPEADAALIVWRQDLAPRWRLSPAPEAHALGRLAAGEPFGTVAANSDPAELGAWLADWLASSLFAAAAT
ncbi:MAG: putative DNA-binding domain-containing protein [Sphingomonadales bacterium]|nr:putative DNA-binding domain-containing protein [Sphingomonadales bacterium]